MARGACAGGVRWRPVRPCGADRCGKPTMCRCASPASPRPARYPLTLAEVPIGTASASGARSFSRAVLCGGRHCRFGHGLSSRMRKSGAAVRWRPRASTRSVSPQETAGSAVRDRREGRPSDESDGWRPSHQRADLEEGTMPMTATPLERLDRLVGTWATDATHPALPGVVVDGTAVIEWLEGERFLIHRARTDHPDFPDSISIIGVTERDRVDKQPGRRCRSRHRVAPVHALLRLARRVPCLRGKHRR